MHLLQGTAGTGKTTCALQFLRDGARSGEATLYVTLAQSKPHLERIARSHGWSLDGVTIHELTPSAVAEKMAGHQTVLATADVELQQVFEDLTALVEEIKPRRAVVDSVSMLQLLAGRVQTYHGEVVRLRELFVRRECTALFIADRPAEARNGLPADIDFHPLAGCIVELSQEPRPYGDVRRLARVVKARGLPSDGGFHDLKILKTGVEVYPRLGAYRLAEHTEFAVQPSGVAVLDDVLGGGLESGTACLIVGPSGTGKSTLASLFATAIAASGKHAAFYLFDERPATYKARAAGLGIPLAEQIAAGNVEMRQLDPAEIAPGQFAQQVREVVEQRGSRVVVLDSIAGYFNAIGSSDIFVGQLHELLTWLSRRGVLTILCGAQEGFMSIGTQPGVDISYLSDTIIVLNYYEVDGGLHRCLAAVKRRGGEIETTIRELSISKSGVALGEPLRDLRGLMIRAAAPPPRARE